MSPMAIRKEGRDEIIKPFLHFWIFFRIKYTSSDFVEGTEHEDPIHHKESVARYTSDDFLQLRGYFSEFLMNSEVGQYFN